MSTCHPLLISSFLILVIVGLETLYCLDSSEILSPFRSFSKMVSLVFGDSENGRPMCLPLAFAISRPSFVRSDSKSLSSFENVPRRYTRASFNGLSMLVSNTPSIVLNVTFFACICCIEVSIVLSDRPSLSRLFVITISFSRMYSINASNFSSFSLGNPL
ncbi:hypothetical protein ALON55S_03298 [Alishewanella longhuensis]